MIRAFFLGFVKIHILYHAAQQPVAGVDIGHELARHGYQLSPGTIYPTLHRLEQEGYLKKEARVTAGKRRNYYVVTDKGRRALAEARDTIRELVTEVVKEG